MYDASLKALSDALSSKQISSRELTTLFLERIERFNSSLNAFITVDRTGALQAADAADRRIAAGERSLLLGIPVAHKDVFCTQNVLTTCGSKMLDNFVSPYDATVVAALKEAGMVMLGKTNCDEFAMGSTNEHSYFGPARNPWNPACVSGGSSGGSAVAVAARLVPATTGTDTGGSIRQPASLCGITGIKPSYGLVSRYGMVAYASSLDQGGPFAKTAEDCAYLLSAMAGFDEKDSTSLNVPRQDYARHLGTSIRGLKIGIPKEYFAEGLHDDVREVVNAALEELRRQGAEMVEVSLPQTHLAIPAYYVIAPAEASSNLSRYDGVRYGHRAPAYGDLTDMYCKSRAEGFGAEVKRRILVGTYVLSHGYYDAYYLQAQKLRRLIAEDFRRALDQCDVIAGPVCPKVAWPIGEMADDPVQMYLADIYTVAVNLAGLPAVSMPAGFCRTGMPVGLQLIGAYFDEARLLQIANAFQAETQWHECLPIVAERAT